MFSFLHRFLIGFLISKSTCRKYEDVVCISFETGIQNIGIAFVIVINTLPQPQVGNTLKIGL